jgi:ABC-type microcin C transport system duplicated ATPase subunit YejF
MADPLLSLRDLTVQFPDQTALRGVSLDIHPGQTVALVGESGSGKTVTARSILRVLPKEADITGGQIQFNGLDLAALGPRSAAGQDPRRCIGMIYQEPMTAMSEFYTIAIRSKKRLIQHGTHRKSRARPSDRDAARRRHPRPEERIDAFSFRIVGRQRQRAMIAMALATEPSLLIADEPTTALECHDPSRRSDPAQTPPRRTRAWRCCSSPTT